MQDFIEQAAKNGVALFKTGKCQFCGAGYERGVFECMDTYNNGLQLLDLANPVHQVSRFLSVDAHALQHPEIHGRWSNHFHLARMNLMLAKGQVWDYKRSPLLSDYLNRYKSGRPDEFLIPPAPLERGNITSKDLTKATTEEECVGLIKKWSDEVYLAWGKHHGLISRIADGFLSGATDNEPLHRKRPSR